MSGGSSGGSDWRPTPKPTSRPKTGGEGDGSGQVPPEPCNIDETTTLNSVDRTVIAGLRVGDVLDVVFQAGPPQRLVAQTSAGAFAGSITSPSMLQIIQCINQAGVTYVADVASVRGAQWQVRVRPR